jgi:hypothetical protein
MENSKRNSYGFQDNLEKKFEKWTGYIDDDIREALREVSGDTYLELRKLTSLLMTLVEKNITQGKYSGYHEGEPLTEEARQGIINSGEDARLIQEDLKEDIKERINSVWVSILNKQKVGFDKLFIALSQKYIKKDDKEN